MASRPRRSTATVVSYAIPQLELSSDTTDGDSDNNSDSNSLHASDQESKPSITPSSPQLTSSGKRRGRPPKNGVSAQPRASPQSASKKGKEKATPKSKPKPRRRKQSSDSGSDFAEELANKSSSESESEEFVDEGASDEEGAGPRDADFDDDIASEGGLSAGSGTPRAGGSFAPKLSQKPGPKGGKKKATPAAVSFQPSAAHASTFANPRVRAPPRAQEAHVDPELVAFGPLFEPPNRRWDGVKGVMVEERALVEWERHGVMQAWAEAPFFLRTSGFADLGWSKDKWDLERGTISERWGGWYGLAEGKVELVEEG